MADDDTTADSGTTADDGGPRSRLDTAWFPWAVVGGLVLAGVVLGGLVALVVAAEQSRNPPSCSGIGFGCELGPGGTAALLAVFFYAPLVAGIAALVAVLQVILPRQRRATSVVALVTAGALVLAALGFIASGSL